MALAELGWIYGEDSPPDPRRSCCVLVAVVRLPAKWSQSCRSVEVDVIARTAFSAAPSVLGAFHR